MAKWTGKIDGWNGQIYNDGRNKYIFVKGIKIQVDANEIAELNNCGGTPDKYGSNIKTGWGRNEFGQLIDHDCEDEIM
jgi:hypothetical protein